jgi:uncharacterized membrane protein
MNLDLLQLTATALMCGVIWIVQLVHYPAFAHVGRENWARFHEMHTRQITFVVMPAMCLELLLSSRVAWSSQELGDRGLRWLIFALVLLTWASTALVQVPLHHRLGVRHDEGQIRRLVRSNWLRTLAWTAALVATLLLLAGC